MGKLDDALKAIDSAATLDPSLPTLGSNRGLILVEVGKKDEAEAELVKAVNQFPDDTRALVAIADFYTSEEKNLGKALTYAQKAAELSPDSPATLLLLARVQKRQKDYDSAVKTILDALKIAPGWPTAQFALGATYEAAGDLVNAEKAYVQLAQKQPKNPIVLLTLASFYADHGKNDEATEQLTKLKALHPAQPVLDTVKALEDKIAGKKTDEAKPDTKQEYQRIGPEIALVIDRQEATHHCMQPARQP